MKHALCHVRRKAVPKQPDSLKDLVIEGEWATTAGPEQENFLLHDNGKDSCQRIVVFVTTDGLKQLTKASTWFMDGCFDIAPKLFLRLYVIRVPLGQSTISTVYALLEKNPTDIRRALQPYPGKVQGIGPFPDPVKVVVDFEYPVIQAIKSML